MDYKWIGALLIITGCGSFGFSMAAGHIREEKQLRKLSWLLDFMSCELQYRLTPLPELCLQASQEAAGELGRVFFDLYQSLSEKTTPDVAGCMDAVLEKDTNLHQRILRLLRILGSGLGRFDLEGQLNGLESVRAECRRELKSMEQDRDARVRSYQTLSLCAGAALAIVLI